MTYSSLCVLLSRTYGLADSIQQQSKTQCVHNRDATFVLHMLGEGLPASSLYIEDGCGTPDEVWDVLQFAKAQGIPVAMGLFGWGIAQHHEFQQAGVSTWINGDQTSSLAAWVINTLQLEPRTSSGSSAIIAVAGSKGGIGKSLATSLVAVGLVRRKARVLVVDGDISNSGVTSTFRIPASAPSYLSIKQLGAGAWTTDHIKSCIWTHPETGIDFLLASDDQDSEDLWLHEWQAMMHTVREMGGYDVILTDTSPEIRKRPYALDLALHNGYVLLPTPVGFDDRMGVGKALTSFGKRDPDVLKRCMLLFIHPEANNVVKVSDVRPRFKQMFPQVHIVGELHRAARQISIAREHYTNFMSPLDVSPTSEFTHDVHCMIEQICKITQVQPALPMPVIPWWKRMMTRTVALPVVRTIAPIIKEA